eukprot:m51a1_g7950 hypothetical protein (938) ;mRNA; f:158188-163020
MATPDDRTMAHPPLAGGDVTEILPDQCVSLFLLPLLSARDLCCLSRTCSRMGSLCAAPALWYGVSVHGDHRVSAVARAPYLRSAVARLLISNVSDAALCSAAMHLGSSLLCLRDVSISQCGLVGDAGAAALGHACRAHLARVELISCRLGAGRGLLTGLAQDCWTEAVLPLERFATDTMSVADLCTAFSRTGSLFEGLKELLLPVVHGDDTDSSAVSAIGWACKSLVALHYGQGVPLVAAAEYSPLLGPCSGTLVALSLGSAHFPLPLTRGLVSRIVELRQLRSLSLVCPVEAAVVSELGKCAPLKKLSLSGLQLTDALVTGPCCSALTVAIFGKAVLSDVVLKLLPTQSLKTLALVHCTGFTPAGLGSFLSGARCLGRLAIHKAPQHHVCDDAMAAVLGGCAGPLRELKELVLTLPKLTDSGVSKLTSLCASLRQLVVHSILMSDVGAEALLQASPRVLDIDLRGCVRLSPGFLGAVAHLCISNVSDAALCSAAMHLGSSLLCLRVRGCPRMTDSALCAVAPECPLLQDVSISQCGLVGDAGAAALGRRGLLTGLAQDYWAAAVLPLERFASDTMSAADLCTAFSSTGSLFEGLKELLLPVVHGSNADSSTKAVSAIGNADSSTKAVSAIGWACKSLVTLHYGQGVPASGLDMLSLCCRSLRSLRVHSVLGYAGPVPSSPWALSRITVDGKVATAEFARCLGQCAGTLVSLSLGRARYPQPLTRGLVSRIAELRQLRSLCLVCPVSLEPDDDEAAVVSELGKCAPLKKLAISGLQLTDALVTGPACSALTVAIFCKTVVCDAVLGLLPTRRLKTLALVHCTGFTPAGLGSFLGGARCLGRLAIHKAAEHHVCDDAMAAVLGGCAESLRELEELVLTLPKLTDGGVSALTSLCSSLRLLVVHSILLSDVGAEALLRAAPQVLDIDLRDCTYTVDEER